MAFCSTAELAGKAAAGLPSHRKVYAFDKTDGVEKGEEEDEIGCEPIEQRDESSHCDFPCGSSVNGDPAAPSLAEARRHSRCHSARDGRGNDAMWVAAGGSSTGAKLRVQWWHEASMTGAGAFATRMTPVIPTAKIMNLNVDRSVEASRKAAQRSAAARER